MSKPVPEAPPSGLPNPGGRPIPRGRRWLWRVVRLLGFVALLAAVSVLGLHLFLNLGLPVIVNRQPERIQIKYDVAWMLSSGAIRVKNLELRQQGPKDQWLLHVDRGVVTIALRDLLDHTVHITAAQAEGASFRWRARADAAPAPVAPLLDTPTFTDAPLAEGPPPTEDATAPIPGLSNPPDPSPEAIYPAARPWRVWLENVEVRDIRELWIADYRYIGHATASGALTLEARKWLEVTGARLRFDGGSVSRGGEPMLTGMEGAVRVELPGTNPADWDGRALLGAFSGDIGLDADVANLSFLDVTVQPRLAPSLPIREFYRDG